MTAPITLNLNARRVRSENVIPRYASIAARVSFALLIFSLALNATLNHVPAPSSVAHASLAAPGGIMETGYMFRLIIDLQSIVGVTLLANRFAHVVILALLACFTSAMVWCVRYRLSPGVRAGDARAQLSV